MQQFKMIIALVAFMFMSQFSLVANADGGKSQGSKGLVGAWIGAVDIDPSIGAPGFPAMLTFHEGGTMAEVHTLYTPDLGSGFGDLLATPSHGAWAKTGPQTYQASFKLFLQGAAGNPNFEGKLVGTNNVNYYIKLSHDGKKLTARWESRIFTPEGNVLLGGFGTFSADRIVVGDLPE